MNFFLDTADVNEIRAGKELGIVDGVTTNPSLVAKTGRKREDVIREIAEIIDGPISAEVIDTKASGMIIEGKALAKIHRNVVVKVPMTMDGLQACKALAGEGIGVNVTLVFQPLQALMAAKAGAMFISPFVGRLDDIGHVGMDLIRQMRVIFDQYGFESQILAASLRHPLHVLESALEGADCATLPYSVLIKLIDHPLTTMGLEKFLADNRQAKA